MVLDARVIALIDTKKEPGHWLWTGSTNYGHPNGTPKFGKVAVRPLVWREYRDDEAPAGARIRASCGVQRCVHPLHLVATLPPRKSEGERTTIELLESIDTRLRNIEHHLGLDPFNRE